MIEDEALAVFRSDVIKQFEAASQEARDQIGLSLSELLAIPEGEVAVAGVVRPDGNLDGVLFLDFGAQAETMHKLIEKATEGIEKNDVTRNEEEIDDTKIVSYQTRSDDAKEKSRDAGGDFVKDTVLVVGGDPATLKERVDMRNWDGKLTNAPCPTTRPIVTSSTSAAKTARIRILRSPGSSIRFRCCKQWRPPIPRRSVRPGPFWGSSPRWASISSKEWVASSKCSEGDFGDTVSRTLIMLERAPQGIGNLFQFDLSAQAPPKWLSADWTSYMVINWNAAKAYSTVESFTDMFLGPGALAGQIQQLADNPVSGNIHVKKDVIDQLSGAIHVATLDGAKEGGKSGPGDSDRSSDQEGRRGAGHSG